MIRSFADVESQRLAGGQRSRKLPPEIQAVARRKLRLIEAAVLLGDLRVPPGNRLEQLSGDWLGFFSIRINSQWRICFRWRDGEAFDVQIRDYH
ncbi:MAG: type II toxin-antitoxin system RelE/ParE family toxin [Tepidiformaceae bacterium]